MMEPTAWAADQFGSFDLGDFRRTTRIVRVAASAAMAPAGTVTAVFTDDAERQEAYDFSNWSGLVDFDDQLRISGIPSPK